jgi:cytochrome P450
MTRPKLTLQELLEEPLGTLSRARDAGWLGEADNGAFIALTHERVRELVADSRLEANFPSLLRSFGITSGPFYEWMSTSPLNRDGADHARWRTLMSRTFTPRSVERLRPFLRSTAHALIDGFAEHGQCEFMAEFADLLPSLGLCELIGVAAEGRDRFRSWANTIGMGFNPVLLVAHIAEVDAALLQLLDYAQELAARRLADPRDDLVTRIAQAGREAGWTDREVRGSIAGLVFAGHETTKNQLGWMVAALADRPDLWDDVAEGRLATADAVEEVLRYRSAATAVARSVPAALEHASESLAPGSRLLLSLWSANHDPAAYPEPDELAPHENRTAPHLAFGHGPHHCLGAALARAELQEALAALAGRLTCPRIGSGVKWKPPLGITGPEALPLTFATRGSNAG